MGNINEAFGPKSFKDTFRLDRLDVPEKKSSAENCYLGMSGRTAKSFYRTLKSTRLPAKSLAGLWKKLHAVAKADMTKPQEEKYEKVDV